MYTEHFPKPLSIKDGVFMCGNETIGHSINAIVSVEHKYFINPGNYGMVPTILCDDDTYIPDGWTLVYALDLQFNEETYLLMIHGDVVESQFKPYEELLKSTHALGVDEVVTQISLHTNDVGGLLFQFNHADWYQYPVKWPA